MTFSDNIMHTLFDRGTLLHTAIVSDTHRTV